MSELPENIVKYIRKMSLRGCEDAEKLCELFGIGIFFNVSFTQEQAEKLASELNEHLKDLYKIYIDEDWTRSELLSFLPECFDEDLELYGYTEICLDKHLTNDGRKHLIDVYLSDVSSEWVNS